LSDPSSADARPSTARYVPVDASEARMARLWGVISARLEQPKKAMPRWVWATTGAFALAAAGAFAFVATQRGPSPWEGAAFETEHAPLTVALADGSSMRLASSSRVEVSGSEEQGVHLALKRGRIECKVTHRRAPSFIVTADGVEVRVVGTRFSVESRRDADASRVEVRVEEGAVEVRSPGRPGEVQRVEAGRTWSQVIRTDPVVGARAEPPPVPSALEADPPSAPAPDAPDASDAPDIKPEAKPVGARELLEEANEYRREGRLADAARSYETLLSRHPKDGRAGLAAFELGRLRMDRLGDLPGAIQALERAMTLAPGSGFREDAMARVVTAYGRSGNAARCTRARDAYLKRYPEGVHRQTVGKQCGGAP
jgi:TolA-binding protein